MGRMKKTDEQKLLKVIFPEKVKELELIGCPWCGECPSIGGIGSAAFTVGCGNMLCSVRPGTISTTLENAVEKWNGRVNPKDEQRFTVDVTIG